MAPCGWTITKCGCGVCWDTYTPQVKATASHLAIMTMWAATGRQFGRCQITVQPCTRRDLLPQYQTYPVDSDGYLSGPYISGGVWHNDCPGTDESTCSCSVDGKCSVLLDGPTTTAGIVAVTLAGVALPAGSYVVLNGNTLVRTDGQCWPSCPSVTSQTTPDFEVTYLVGRVIPDAVQAATERLACEYAKACKGGPCVLPQTLKTLTRQGVELEVADLPDEGTAIRTGIREVDTIIKAVNPHGLTRRPSVLSLDMPRPMRVV
jgi:hypothetical protein